MINEIRKENIILGRYDNLTTEALTEDHLNIIIPMNEPYLDIPTTKNSQLSEYREK